MPVARSLSEAAKAFLFTAAFPGLCESRWVRKAQSLRPLGVIGTVANGLPSSKPSCMSGAAKAFPFHQLLSWSL